MEWESYLRFVLALVFVLGLLDLLTWVAKRFGLDRAAGGRPGRHGRGGRRLAILEALPVDARRKLLLVKRDGREHLILIGGPQDLLVESGIAADDRDDEAAMPGSEETGALHLLRGIGSAVPGGGRAT